MKVEVGKNVEIGCPWHPEDKMIVLEPGKYPVQKLVFRGQVYWLLCDGEWSEGKGAGLTKSAWQKAGCRLRWF